MTRVVLEVAGTDGWTQVGQALTAADPPGSLSSGEVDRQVYVFGWYDGMGPAVWRSVGGVDVASPEVRVVTSMGLELLADLTAGPHEITLWRPGDPRMVRFRCEER